MNRKRSPSDWQMYNGRNFPRFFQPFNHYVNAIFYVVKSGCRRRMLPYDMPPSQTVYYHFRKWEADNTWLLIHQALHEHTRCDGGKAPSPTAAIIDSQSFKTTEMAARV